MFENPISKVFRMSPDIKGLDIGHTGDTITFKVRSLHINTCEMVSVIRETLALIGKYCPKTISYVVEPCRKKFETLWGMKEFLEAVQKDNLYFVLEKPEQMEWIGLYMSESGVCRLTMGFKHERPEIVGYSYDWGNRVNSDGNKIRSIGIDFKFKDEHLAQLLLNLDKLPDYIKNDSYREFVFCNKYEITVLFAPDHSFVGNAIGGTA
jgi:hypothetical protein